MRCFYCGKRKTSRSIFYKLDKEGHEICQSCMREGYTKSALEIIEHNKQADMRKEKEIQDLKLKSLELRVRQHYDKEFAKMIMRKEDEGK